MNEILLQAQRELCKRSLYHFFQYFWSTIEHSNELIEAPHVKFICDEIQGALLLLANKEENEQDILINVPPRFLKSTIVSVMAPVWIWIHNPSLDILVGGHRSDLTMKHTGNSRDIIKSEKFQTLYPSLKLRDDNDRKTEYANTQGGTRIGATPGKDVTGQNADLIIIDDPIGVKNDKNVIAKANEWITGQLFNRKNDQRVSLVITIMQRIAETDPSGMLLQYNPDTYHICLPVEMTQDVKPKKAEQLYTDHLLDPIRFPQKVLKVLKGKPIQYANRYLQNPEPSEGGIIKREWIKVEPKDMRLLTELKDVEAHFFVDTAYTSDISNDPTGIITVKKHDNVIYVMDAQNWWLEFPELVKKLQSYTSSRGYTTKSKIYIEPKSSGKSAVQTLKRDTILNIIEDKPPHESKDERLTSISPVLESGRLVVVEGNWNDEYISQLTAVKPAHDEYRDVTVMAVRNLLQKKIKPKLWTAAVN